MSDESVEIHLEFPFPGDRVFRYRAMEDIIELLVRNPHREFTITQLRDITDNGQKTTTASVDLLDALGVIGTWADGRQRLVSLDRDRVSIPDDPLFQIPQDEFRDPIRAFRDRVTEESDALAGMIVFGSVARGEADRRSDIDVWILVEDDEALLETRRTVQKIASELGERRFDGASSVETGDDTPGTPPEGDRYEFEPLVESVETATDYGEKLREIFSEGIVIVDSEALAEVKTTVLEKGGVEDA